MLFMHRKCHIGENAYQNETNIIWYNRDNIFLCLRPSQVNKGEYSREIYFTHGDVMLKSALMLLVNPLVVFSGLYVYSYFKESRIYWE